MIINVNIYINNILSFCKKTLEKSWISGLTVGEGIGREGY